MEQILSVPVYVLLFLTLYFEVFLIVTYWEHRHQFAMDPAPEIPPEKYLSVTIIVPAWNEEHTLARTIDSLLALDYPKEKLRILIVDDGSTDRTYEVAQSYANPPFVRVLRKTNGGKHTAMNLGIAMATTDLVGCLDADSFVDRNALKEIVSYFGQEDVMAVTPSVQIHHPGTFIRRIQAVEYMIGEFTRKIFSRFNGLYVTPGPFSIYRRVVFEKIGGFVHGYGTEDMEMAMRMQANHMRIENAHTALVFTVSPSSYRALYKQRVRWVTGFLKNTFYTYRYMFFNKKYGNLGMLTMPFAFLSIFIALFFSLQYLYVIYTNIEERIIRYSVLGFRFNPSWPTFDLFTFNLEFRRLLIYVLLGITIAFVLGGSYMATRRWHLSRNMLYFLFFYGLLAPWWLMKSVYNLVTSKEAPWR
jgi:cellulose synthase/poly-beta-1,6-N-acetylglucosamine synthase-like glycosyltransferase